MKQSLLVLYPPEQAYYPQHEVFGLLPSFTPTFLSSDDSFASQSTQRMGFRTVRYDEGVPGLTVGQKEHRSIPQLRAILRETRPDVVVTFELQSRLSYDVARQKAEFGYRTVILADVSSPPSRSAWRWFPTTAWFAAYTRTTADLVVCHTHRSQMAAVSWGVPPSRVCYVPAGIRLAEGGSPHRRASVGPLRVLYFGALRENKGVELLPAALATLRRAGVPLELTIAGSGPLSLELAAISGPTSGLSFLGRVSEAVKSSLLSGADLFIYPSVTQRFLGLVRWEEQTAISAVEAMGSGVPCLGSDSGCLPEVLGYPDAVFPQGSAAAVSDSLMRAATNPDWLYDLACRQFQRAGQEYDIRGCARRLDGALARLIPEVSP